MSEDLTTFSDNELLDLKDTTWIDPDGRELLVTAIRWKVVRYGLSLEAAAVMEVSDDGEPLLFVGTARQLARMLKEKRYNRK